MSHLDHIMYWLYSTLRVVTDANAFCRAAVSQTVTNARRLSLS